VQIDHLAAGIRPRTPWEGLDLGFALGRRWFLSLFGLWWLMACSVAVPGALWLGDSPGTWLFLVWWFKPLYEAPLLFWLSRALFGERLRLREFWLARGQILTVRLLPVLLWRRLSPNRAFQMPLLLLEALSGKTRRQRQRVLRDPGGTSAWLTIICVHLESILWMSGLLLVAAMIPAELARLDLAAALFEEQSTPYWISNLLFLLAMSVMAPFYVAAGFALYLARRTELEAWDLELQFRRAADAESRPARRKLQPAGAALLALAAGAWACLPRPAPALELTPDQARAEIESVLRDEDFGLTREIQTWIYLGEERNQEDRLEAPDWLLGVLQALGHAGELTAVVLKWALLLMAAVLVVVILQRTLRELEGRRKTAANRQTGAAEAQHLSPPRPPVILPSNIPASVQSFIDRGDFRGALALLYLASIDLLKNRRGIAIPDSATESELLSLVLEALPANEAQLMQRLVTAWQRLAYAHRSPVPGALTGLLEDWRQWEDGSGAS
jgi:hypothetical protein